MATMLLGGLWHGASWTFVFWGGLHGLYLVAEQAAERRFRLKERQRRQSFRVGYGLFTYALVCFAWVFFRAEGFGSAFAIAAAMCGFGPATGEPLLTVLQLQTVAMLTTVTLGLHWSLRDTTLDRVVARWPWWATALGIAIMITLIFTTPGEDRAFIYFQF